MADRWFVPASFTTLLSDLALAAQANLWSELWVIASLIGYAVLAATGPLMLKRLIEKTLASADDHDRHCSDGVQAEPVRPDPLGRFGCSVSCRGSRIPRAGS